MPCAFWAVEVNFISANSIRDHTKVGMNQLVALAYFTASQSTSLSLLELSGDSTVRYLYSICKTYMKKKADDDIIELMDQSTQEIKKAIESDDGPILTLNSISCPINFKSK
ncbi:unnamed protein product [Mucor hiemalis]